MLRRILARLKLKNCCPLPGCIILFESQRLKSTNFTTLRISHKPLSASVTSILRIINFMFQHPTKLKKYSSYFYYIRLKNLIFGKSVIFNLIRQELLYQQPDFCKNLRPLIFILRLRFCRQNHLPVTHNILLQNSINLNSDFRK